MTTPRAAAVARRAGWVIADQALSSLTNFVLGVLAARVLGPEGFGAFALGSITYLFCLNLSRALTTDPFTVRESAAPEEARRRAVPAATGAAVACGIVGGAISAAAGAAIGGPTGLALVAFGVAMPGALLQDAWRYVFFAAATPRTAVVNDAAWAVAQLASMGSLIALGRADLLSLIAAWGGSAVVAAVLGAAQASALPAPARAWSWLRANGDLGIRYAADALAVVGATSVGTYALGAISGLAAVGAIRAAQLLLGPLNVVYIGGTSIVVPEGARLLTAARRRLPAALAGYSAALVAAMVVYSVALGLALRTGDLGAALLGRTAMGAAAVLVPTALLFVANGATAGGVLGLRVLAAAADGLRARLIVATMTLAASVAGALVAGAWGFAAGSAAAAAVGAAVFWAVFARAFRAPERSGRAMRHAPPLGVEL